MGKKMDIYCSLFKQPSSFFQGMESLRCGQGKARSLGVGMELEKLVKGM